jgi:hypothetical protein
MSRTSKSLPAIPVKHVSIRKVLNVTPPFESRLRAYIGYYTEQQGLVPAQAPTDADTIVALVETFLTCDKGFNQYLRSTASERGRCARTAESKKSFTPTSDA